MQKILLNISKYDYGIRQNGLSYEYVNFFNMLKSFNYEVQLFDFPTIMGNVGKDKMNKELIKAIHEYHPDLIFSLFPPNYYDEKTLRTMKLISSKSVIWMTDDEWMW